MNNVPSTENPLSLKRASEIAPGNEQSARKFPQDKRATRFRRFYSSALSRCNARPLPISLSSRRLRVPGKIENVPEPSLTIDTATDVPLVSCNYLQHHPVLRNRKIHKVPQDAVQLRSANGSRMQILGFVSFDLTLGSHTRRVECFVTPSLGPDGVLLNNELLALFEGVLDWQAQTLSFKNATETIPATHRHDGSLESTCSRIAIVNDATPVRAYTRSTVYVPPKSEMVIEVRTARSPCATTLALIEPRIETNMDRSVVAPEEASIWQAMIVARTVTQWDKKDASGVVQVCNTSSTGVTVPADTVIGTMCPVTEVTPLTTSAVLLDSSSLATARQELTAALRTAFVDSTFTAAQQNEVLALCSRYRKVFSLTTKELGLCRTMEVSIPLQPGTVPVHRPPYKTHPRAQDIINECVDQLEANGIVEKRASPWSSPTTVVTKRSGEPRFCIDYRGTINKSLVKESWPIPDIESRIDSVGGARFISVLDLQSAYHQLKIKDDDVPKTAFSTTKGKYVFKRLPFGLAHAPFCFARLMDETFSHFGPKSGLLTYMDDILLCSNTWTRHLRLLEDTFQALLAVGLTLKPSKIQFGRSEVKYLGHIISQEGIKIGNDRIKAIARLPRPSTIRELRSFLGAINFVRKYIPRFSEIVDPLIALTRKETARHRSLQRFWMTEHTRAFLTIKQLITTAPILHFPNLAHEFIVHSDASDQGAGAMLTQKRGSSEAVIAYFSKWFSASQERYSATAKECLAVVLAIQHW